MLPELRHLLASGNLYQGRQQWLAAHVVHILILILSSVLVLSRYQYHISNRTNDYSGVYKLCLDTFEDISTQFVRVDLTGSGAPADQLHMLMPAKAFVVEAVRQQR